MIIYLVACLTAGFVGFLTFLVVHHFWIEPIWYITLPGLFFAALGGLAVGWSYGEIRRVVTPLSNSQPEHWHSLVVLLSAVIILSPSALLAQLRSSLLDSSSGTLTIADPRRAVAHFVIELLLTSTLTGSVLGWLLTHTFRASFATGLAGFVFALGPGHNIPFLGNTPGAGKGLVLLLIVVSVSSIALVEVSLWLNTHKLLL